METQTQKPRSAQRQRTLNGGRVLIHDQQSTYDCVIRDMSATGCRLRFSQPTPLPQSFELLVTKSGQVYPAQLRWNKNAEAGLAFTGPARILGS